MFHASHFTFHVSRSTRFFPLPFSLFLLLTSFVHAQQDPLLTQYMYQKLEFNPAYAGSREGFSADLVTRFQWVGMEGVPRTLWLTAHTQLRNPHIGVGMYASCDELGPTVDYNVMGTFAYRILFPGCRLAFGISAGIKYYDIDWSALNPKDPGDIELVSGTRNAVVPDLDFGIWFSHPRYYAGISSKHLLQNQLVVSGSSPGGETSFTRLLRNFYGIAGGTVALGGRLVFIPSVLVKYVQHAPVQADFSALFKLLDRFTMGISYRTTQALGFLVAVEFGKGFSIGYAYDVWFNPLQVHNKGSHEIRIGYETDLFSRTRMLSPRYF